MFLTKIGSQSPFRICIQFNQMFCSGFIATFNATSYDWRRRTQSNTKLGHAEYYHFLARVTLLNHTRDFVPSNQGGNEVGT
jgi:hypothetical protein